MKISSFISFSGGVESSTLCLLFPESTPIFADTGWEHPEMYQRIEFIEGKLKEVHGTDFKIVKVSAHNPEGTQAKSLPEYILLRKFFPWIRARFCTRLFKIKPIDDFLKSQGSCELLIGLNADEEQDREGNYGEMENVIYRYPLIELGMSRQDCISLLSKHGLAPRFPKWMERGGCYGCFFKGKKEFALMAKHDPETIYKLADLEDAVQDRRSQRFSIHRDIPNMREFANWVRQQKEFDFMNDGTPEGSAELQTPCGAFCHR